MDSTSVFSTVLFDCLCNDLDLYPEPTGSRFNPFPSGIPVDSELTSREFARYALLASVFKKSEDEVSPTAETDTLSSFLAANAACELRNQSAFCPPEDDLSVGLVINGARVILDRAFFPDGDPLVTMGSIESAARFGPGRSVGMGDKPTLLYFKVGDSVQTAGSEFVRSWYEISTHHNPVCEAAEMARKARHGEARIVGHGNLAFQPKSYVAKRISITEPSLNTYFQLGFGVVMEEALLHAFHISLQTQPAKNAELARQGSISGVYATVDLKQCSDYISRSLVRYLFPPSVVRWMEKLRTHRVQFVDLSVNNGEKSKRQTVDLHMMSTMGNGFTFPMQTLLLASLVRSTLDVLGVDGEWGVFGDDIVIPTCCYPLLCRVIAACGLIVNEKKSFSAGLFRESCGSDWFDGVNVRGVYLKHYTTDQDLFSCYNRLALWSARHDVPLKSTLNCILQVVGGVAPLVPPDEPVTAGIRTPMPLDPPDPVTGLWTYFPYRVKPCSFTTEPWLSYEIGCDLKGKPRKFQQWVNDLKRFCDGSFNEPALLKALLAGGLRRYKMVFRESDRPSYRQHRAVTPRWGFSTEETFPQERDDCFQRLQLLIEASFQSLLD